MRILFISLFVLMLNGSTGSISSVDDLKINDKNKQSIQAVPGGQDI